MGKPVEGTVKPIVRTAKSVIEGATVGGGALVKSVICYAYCAIDGTLLSKHAGLWARNGLKCPKCGHTTWYIKREWRGIPLVDESTFDITQYVQPPKVESTAPVSSEALVQRAPELDFQKSLLARLTRIARALERLADAWDGRRESI